ncbi:ABC transporter permease [Listeria aquatica]|uniref:ABC transporter permease n=1 Tax=Listeria aquatica TaxID=1494960 RepID=UPI003EF74C29
MNFIKRAYWSLKARIGRSILLFIIFTIVSVLVLSGFTIQSAANKASELARKELGGTVTLSYDREKQMEQAEQNSENSSSNSSERKAPSFNTTPVKTSAAESLAKLNHVTSYNLYSSTQALAEDFDPVKSSGDSSQEESSDSANNAGEEGRLGGGNSTENRPQMIQADLSVSGVLDSASSTDFSEKSAKLTSGRALTKADENKKVVLVEKTLASQNKWKIGDSIKIQSSDEKTSVTLKIVGIYKSSDSSSSNNGMANNFSFLNPYNKIYVPYTIANTLKGAKYEGTVDSAVYTMDDAANITAFQKEAKKMNTIDWDEFKLDANDSLYKQMIGPIENVASFSKNVVYIVSIAGVLMLALLVMMQIRERKYEMGVLLSIGEKKTKLLGQFFVEIFIVAMISFIVAGLASPFVAQVAGNQLLNQENSQTAETNSTSGNSTGQSGQDHRGNGPSGGGPFGSVSSSFENLTKNQEEIKKLDIQVTPAEIGKMAGIGFLIAFISVVIPGTSILRMNPKTILTKQE